MHASVVCLHLKSNVKHFPTGNKSMVVGSVVVVIFDKGGEGGFYIMVLLIFYDFFSVLCIRFVKFVFHFY